MSGKPKDEAPVRVDSTCLRSKEKWVISRSGKVGDLDIAKDKDVSISPDVLEKVIVSVTEQTYAETDTDTDEDGEASEA